MKVTTAPVTSAVDDVAMQLDKEEMSPKLNRYTGHPSGGTLK